MRRICFDLYARRPNFLEAKKWELSMKKSREQKKERKRK